LSLRAKQSAGVAIQSYVFLFVSIYWIATGVSHPRDDNGVTPLNFYLFKQLHISCLIKIPEMGIF
ncbi:MAG: hypothetical protein IJ500_03225, partial [Alphaproteobacteria bacterium]|nr:hypothetical protein [Alphaproteobacteria bacterium]